MALNNYNPLTDTIDIVISAFLSIIILGLFKYFANDKMKKGSPINVFDDIIVLLSFVIYPVINASQWFQYFTALNRSMFISSISEGPFFTLSCYFIWLASFNRDEVSFELMRKVSIYILITVNVILVNIPYLTIITGDLTPEKSLTLNPNDYISNFCIEYIGISTCNNLRISFNVLRPLMIYNGIAVVCYFIMFFLSILNDKWCKWCQKTNHNTNDCWFAPKLPEIMSYELKLPEVTSQEWKEKIKCTNRSIRCKAVYHDEGKQCPQNYPYSDPRRWNNN